MNGLQRMIVESEARGKAEGMAEGELSGMRDSVRGILRARFGSIPPVLEERIAAASVQTLSDLIVRASTLPTIAEI